MALLLPHYYRRSLRVVAHIRICMLGSLCALAVLKNTKNLLQTINPATKDFQNGDMTIMATILIIEDEPRIDRDMDEITNAIPAQKDIMKIIFQTEGYEVLVAHGKDQALAILKLRANNIDLITCDGGIWKNNGKSEELGKDIIPAIRASGYDKSIAYISFSNPGEILLQKIGANAFVRKQVLGETLIPMLQAMINGDENPPLPEHAYLVSPLNKKPEPASTAREQYSFTLDF